jgi:hypothetical protein
VAIAGVVVWQLGSWFFGQRVGPENLVNQIWIERVPRDARDMIWHFIAAESDNRRQGSLGRASRWRVASDAFVWSRDGATFRAVLPQNGCHLNLRARTWKCAGQAPEPFELCLELRSDKQVFRYYSRHDWSIRPRGELDEQIAWLAPALQAAEAAPSEEPVPLAGTDACEIGGPAD